MEVFVSLILILSPAKIDSAFQLISILSCSSEGAPSNSGPLLVIVTASCISLFDGRPCVFCDLVDRDLKNVAVTAEFSSQSSSSSKKNE